MRRLLGRRRPQGLQTSDGPKSMQPDLVQVDGHDNATALIYDLKRPPVPGRLGLLLVQQLPDRLRRFQDSGCVARQLQAVWIKDALGAVR